ncbi:MAG: DUF6768 family protein [Parvularculaceae bacterium]
MSELDRQIEKALDAEDRALLEQFGEQGLLAQGFSIFQGKQGWIALISAIVIFLLAAGSLYSGWKYLQIGEGVEAMKWGAACLFLALMVAFMKMWLWMRMESNRVIREIKRVELQVARLQAKEAD